MVTLKRLPFFLILLISSLAYGQESDCAASLLNTFLSVDQASAASTSSFNDFLKKLENKHGSIKNESDFIRYVFTKTHQQYLKRYEASASISTLFNKGSYNCLTGTILYTLILNHFQITHQVIETNYHIFILAETKQGRILLEATDPVDGFAATSDDIEKRITAYKENTVQASNSKVSYHQFNFQLFNPVSIEELRGLLYYNKAVESYNHRNLQESVRFLTMAHGLYSSSRINEFSQILLLALQRSTLENQLRTQYIKAVLSIRQDLLPIVASLN